MKKKSVQTEITRTVMFLDSGKPDSEEYTRAANNLKTLCEAEKNRRIDIVPIIGFGVQILISVLVLRFERFDVVSTKLTQFIKKIF